jgi:hypothetical protein
MQKLTKTRNSDSTQDTDLQMENLETNSSLESGPHTLLRSLDEQPMKVTQSPTHSKSKTKPLNTLLISLLVVVSGTITGFGLHKAIGSSGLPGTNSDGVSGVEQGSGLIEDGSIKTGQVLGNTEKTGDSAEGVLVAGGINGEGSHRILRPGGPSQTVYLTSSVIDLTQIEGHKIKVWGETFSAQSAGWLMDVVTVEILELNAPLPFQED